MTATITIKSADMGSVSHGTLKTEDLLNAFAHELEWQIRRNGDFFSLPENFTLRDKLNSIAEEAFELFDDGETIIESKWDKAAEMVNETLPDVLQTFCLPYFYFGAHPGDGADFGYWLSEGFEDDYEGFKSSQEQEYPEADYRGEWLHINERGNCTLYVRGNNGQDVEVWGVV